MKVVCDSTILIVLAKLNRLNILYKVFEKIYIPYAVFEEIVVDGKGKPGSIEVEQAEWIKKVKVKDHFAVNILKKNLNKGESEAIVLAQEISADYIVIDEYARKTADFLGLKVIGTLGVMAIAYKKQIISDFKQILDKIIENGFYLKESLYKKVLEDLNIQ